MQIGRYAVAVVLGLSSFALLGGATSATAAAKPTISGPKPIKAPEDNSVAMRLPPPQKPTTSTTKSTTTTTTVNSTKTSK